MGQKDFSKKELNVLKQYFTNTDNNIFCLINLPEVIKGTLFSRYSRSPKSVRRLFLDEFFVSEDVGDLFKKKSGTQDQNIDITRAEDFYERILVGYGDDSVAELGGVHIAIENISNIAVKVIQDARIGLSPLEKSSRYVFFDEKDSDGTYQYYRPTRLLRSKHGKAYLQFMDELFEFYSTTVQDLYTYLTETEEKPDDVPQYVFNASCRAKACDVVRYILPMSTLTNMGVYGNGRAFEYLLIKMMAHPLQEVREAAKAMQTELRKVIPAFVKRSANDRGKVYQKYLKTLHTSIENTTKKHAPEEENKKPQIISNSVKLVQYDDNALNTIIKHLLFAKSNASLNELANVAMRMSRDEKEEILKDLAEGRQNRHHKPPRALENTTYTFEITSDIGAFRDLHRHRMLSQERQHYTTNIGYIIPDEIEKVGLTKKYTELMERAHKIYNTIAKDFPEEAQYVVPFGYGIRYYFTLNLREVVHLTELRSISQGHPSYREIAQEIAKQVTKVHPYFKHLLQFVDYKPYTLERLDAFKRIDQKAQKMGLKTFINE